MGMAPGLRVGPYEVLGALGAGGMGEVWRARDPRLGREVALKVLPASVAGDADRLRRFEQEARAAGALNHPNVLGVLDVGEHAGTPYLVTELLEGATLRERLEDGRLPPRKALDYGGQIARGLAAAHDKGIIHRDLKPENLFITKDGRIKILDFGLAKAVGGEVSPTESTLAETAPGAVLGTAGYMAPEQVRGRPTDARADVFAFGAVLYEMLAGERAFPGDSALDRGHAILNREPPPLPADVPPAVQRVVQRCLEKAPAERFQTARDLSYALEAVGDGLGSSGGPSAQPGVRRRRVSVVLAAAVAVVALGAGVAAERLRRRPPAPVTRPAPASQPAPAAIRFQQLTFRRGTVHQARFAPDGRTVVFSAAWDGDPPEVHAMVPGHLESRLLLGPGYVLAAVSRRGELAVIGAGQGGRFFGYEATVAGAVQLGQLFGTGALSRSHLGGGVGRAEHTNITAADYSPDGSLVVARWHVAGGTVGPKTTIEGPPGTVLAERPGAVDSLRVAPDGRRIAWVEHRTTDDDEGLVMALDRAGGVPIPLGPRSMSTKGLAFSPDGREVWAACQLPAAGATRRTLYAVQPGGAARLIIEVPGDLTLFDTAPDGRVLLASVDVRQDQIVLAPGAAAERTLTWLGYGLLPELSRDGRTVVFTEASGGRVTTYLRPVAGGPAVRLDEGQEMALSPDGRWVVTTTYPVVDRLRLVPTGPGSRRELPRGPVEEFNPALRGAFSPDSKRLFFFGRTAAGWQVLVQDLEGGDPRPLAAAQPWPDWFLSPDGTTMLLKSADGSRRLQPVAGGPARAARGLNPDDLVAGWTVNGREVFVMPGHVGAARYTIARVDLVTGARRPWRTFALADQAGGDGLFVTHVLPDGLGYAYVVYRNRSTMHVVEGLR
jgi:eukaryotic-like serine/threonine-protein kinase